MLLALSTITHMEVRTMVKNAKGQRALVRVHDEAAKPAVTRQPPKQGNNPSASAKTTTTRASKERIITCSTKVKPTVKDLPTKSMLAKLAEETTKQDDDDDAPVCVKKKMRKRSLSRGGRNNKFLNKQSRTRTDAGPRPSALVETAHVPTFFITKTTSKDGSMTRAIAAVHTQKSQAFLNSSTGSLEAGAPNIPTITQVNAQALVTIEPVRKTDAFLEEAGVTAATTIKSTSSTETTNPTVGPSQPTKVGSVPSMSNKSGTGIATPSNQAFVSVTQADDQTSLIGAFSDEIEAEFSTSIHSIVAFPKMTSIETSAGFVIQRNISALSGGVPDEQLMNPAHSAAPFQPDEPIINTDSMTIPPSLHEESEDLWNAYLAETFNQIAGYGLDSYDAFEPIPYHLITAGVAVDADDDFSNMLNSPSNKARAVNFAESHESFPAKNGAGKTLAVLQGNQEPHARSCHKPPVAAAPRYKRQSEYINDDEDEPSKRAKTEVVGPDTWQMKIVNRMIVYLEEAQECAYARHIDDFHTVTAHCTALHAKGVHKYLHLPGAIFEEIVEITGGPDFLAIYNAAKTFHHPRLDALRCNDQLLVSHDVKKLKAISTTTGYPNLLQVAVGYGFHLAQMRAANEGQHAAGVIGNYANKGMVEDGAQIVLDMSEDDRMAFYMEHIGQSIASDHQ